MIDPVVIPSLLGLFVLSVIVEAIKDDRQRHHHHRYRDPAGQVLRGHPDCHQPETLHKTLIVGGIPVELHRAGLWLSHEDRQRERSTDGKPDL